MKKAYLLAAVSILFWSSLATISKLLLGTMDSMQVLCVSALFAALALLVVNIVTGKLKTLKQYQPKDFLIMALIGLPGTFFYYIFLYGGTAILPASQAFIINYLWPIMSVVFACLLLKEKMTVRKIIAIVMSFIGIIIVTAGGGLDALGGSTLLGALLCVLDAVSYGLFTALHQRFHYDKTVSMMVAFFTSFVLSGGYNLVTAKPLTLDWLPLLGLAWNGIFVMAVASVTWALALDGGKTAKISNLAYITPFLSLVWTAVFLHEPITLYAVLGLVVIVLGIFIQLRDHKAVSVPRDKE